MGYISEGGDFSQTQDVSTSKESTAERTHPGIIKGSNEDMVGESGVRPSEDQEINLQKGINRGERLHPASFDSDNKSYPQKDTEEGIVETIATRSSLEKIGPN